MHIQFVYYLTANTYVNQRGPKQFEFGTVGGNAMRSDACDVGYVVQATLWEQSCAISGCTGHVVLSSRVSPVR
eukprot:4952985-Pyramimonas_sp.AAC.1